MTRVLLQASNLTKGFPGVRALDDVSLSVHTGEVLALVGHNGSGKSTLVKILAGVCIPDSGDVRTASAGEQGIHSGLHFIHQDLGLIPMLSTIENLDLVRSLGTNGWLPARLRRERVHARDVIGRFGAHFDVDAPVSTLSPAERTIVAIARALDGWTSSDNVLVLDEPTAALQQEDVRKLFDAIKSVTAEGAGVILISHRLDEVVDLADRVVVLRDGRLVADQRRGAFDRNSLIALVAGVAEAPEVEVARRCSGGDVVLTIKGLRSSHLHGIDLEVRAGEIVGVTGLLGSGMEHVGSAVFGGSDREGAVWVAGEPLVAGSAAAAIKAGVGFVPADRRFKAAIVTMNARENLTLPRLAPVRGRMGQIIRRAESVDAQQWMNQVEVQPPHAQGRSFSLFSGGNQQKILIAKWLRNSPRVLLLEEPTQGVDVAAQASIHRLVARAAQDGAAVLVSSTDTKELISLCHRVVVLAKGQVVASMEGSQLTESALVRATLEGSAQSAQDGQAKSGD